jgi:hypothetical protein
MAKRRLSAGLRGTTSAKDTCGALPPWISRRTEAPPPRLLCKLRPGHSAKRHINEQGHQWDVIGRDKGNRSARR